MALRIKNWNKHYENDRSRDRDSLRWCPIPNKRGLGRGRLLRMENGPAMYGCFVSIVLMCSEQERPREGWLTENGLPDGPPLDAEAIHLKTGMPTDLISKTLTTISDCKIGWIEELTPDSPSTPHEPTPNTPRKEGKGKEERGGTPHRGDGSVGEEKKPNPTKEVFDYFCAQYEQKHGRKYAATFAKDQRLLKDLIAVDGVETVKKKILTYLSSTDKFVADNGWTIGVLKVRYNALGATTVDKYANVPHL